MRERFDMRNDDSGQKIRPGRRGHDPALHGVWIKKQPSIPTIGTKGIPSAVPPAIRQIWRSFRSADTLAVCNGTTRQTLLTNVFRQQLVGESPVSYPERLTPFRSRCVDKPDTRQPSLGFSHIPNIVTYSQKLCKYFLHIAPKKLRPHRSFVTSVLLTRTPENGILWKNKYKENCCL